MISLASRILQKMLDMNRYAALPFVETGRHQDAHTWLMDLRERLIGVLADIDRSVVEVTSLHTSDEEHWSQTEQVAFSEWLLRRYPNEHSGAVIALGEAWKEGQQFGIATRPLHAMANGRPAAAAGGLIDTDGQLTPGGTALASAIAAALASTSAHAQTGA